MMVRSRLTAAQVIDLAPEGFSPQNTINEIWIDVPRTLPGYEMSGDVELKLEPI